MISKSTLRRAFEALLSQLPATILTFQGPVSFQNVYEDDGLCLAQCLCNDKDDFIKRALQRTKVFKIKQGITSSIQRFRFAVKG